MTTWFTSDTHFGHANIVGYCRRPFRDVHQMDRVMIRRWATLVEPDDVVYHLGDFCWGGPGRMEKLLTLLPGRKHLIRGNHDPKLTRCAKVDGWEWVLDYHEVELDGYQVVMSHYPITEWNGYFGGSLHLHGHCHGTRPAPDLRRMDVGVDVYDFRPISWQHVKDAMLVVPAPPVPARPYEGVGE